MAPLEMLRTLLPLTLLTTLTACPAATTPVAPPPDPAPPSPPLVEPPPPPPPCLALGDEAYAVAPMLERVALTEDGAGVFFCRREVDAPACWTIDLETGALREAAVPGDIDAGWERPPAPPPLQVAEDQRSAQVCPEGGRCKALKLPFAGAIVVDTAVSDDRRYAALTLTRGEQYTIQLYALPAGRALKRITVPSDPYPCASARFLGGALLVLQNICAGPAGNAWLADPATAKRIAWVGGSPDFGAWSVHEQHVDGDLWAFRQDNGREVVIQSAKDGRIVHRINLDDTFPKGEDGTPLADPDSGMMLRNRTNGELVVVHDGPAQGKIVRVDPREGTVVKVITAPRCLR